INQYLSDSGYDGIDLETDEGSFGRKVHSIIALDSTQVKDALHNAGTYSNENPSTLFSASKRDLLEEAAGFDTWQEWRDFVLYMNDGDVGEFNADLQQNLDSDERLNAWFKKFHEDAVKAIKSRDADPYAPDAEPATERTPAEADKEFLETIKDESTFEEFIDRAASIYNNQFLDGPMDEEEAASMEAEKDLQDDMTRVMAHASWTSLFKGGGNLSNETQAKRLLGLIRKNPRDYRGIYARVMGIPELEVSAEDSMAEQIKYDLADTRRDNIERLSPEKLRELADQNEVDEFAEQLRTGKAKFASDAEKRYIKQQDEEIKKLRENLDKEEGAHQENMNYLTRIVGRDFMAVFDRAVQIKENIRRQEDKLKRAIRRGEVDAVRTGRILKSMKGSYTTVVSELEALARAHKLELDVQAALNEQLRADERKALEAELAELRMCCATLKPWARPRGPRRLRPPRPAWFVRPHRLARS
ncbi:MAG: hypothetical protein LBU28_03310, partial [Spirochaetaceae bacterium]|nr:hypothetical protein [Spirochaetaceae bacterium]